MLLRQRSFLAALGLLCLLPTLTHATPPRMPRHRAAPPVVRRHSALTPADRSYLVKLQTNSHYLTDDLSEYARLTAKPRLNDKKWIHQMAVVLSAMRLLVTQGRALRPTPRYRAAQNTYQTALGQYDRVYQVIPGAIGHRDKAAIARCNGYLAAAARDTRLAAAQIKAASR